MSHKPSSSNIIIEPNSHGQQMEYKKLRELGRGGFATCY